MVSHFRVTVQRFYQTSLLLPLIVPALMIAGVFIFGSPSSPLLSDLGVVFAGSLFVGGLPYLVVVIWILRRIRGQDEATIRRTFVRAPLVMVTLFVVLTAVIGILSDDWIDTGMFIAICAVATLLLGYAYVGAVFYLRHLAASEGWLENRFGERGDSVTRDR